MMRRLLWLLVFASVVPAAGAQQSPSALADSARAVLVRSGSPGGQVVVMKDGRVLHSLAWGMAQVDSVRPVTAETRFRIGSVVKLFTATAAALLWEQGRLDIDAPVRTAVPEFKPEHAAVTPRALAGHVAGIRHYLPRDFMRPPKRYDDVAETLEIFAADSLIATPYTHYGYSSYGYNLLGVAVQRASGEEFRRHIARVVLAPVGMSHTLPERSDSAIAQLAAVYEPAPAGSPRPTRRTDLSDRWPSGGYLSTATDIAKFAEATVRGPWLSARVRELLFTRVQLVGGESTDVAFGWRVGTDSSRRVVYHHGGASAGGRAMLVVWRDAPVVVAITANLSGARVTEADALMLGSLVIAPD